MSVCMHGPNVHTSKAGVCMFVGDIAESYIPIMYVCPGKHTYPVCMYVCMYVCPGKHTDRVNYRYVWYVCMSGYMCNTDVYVAKECR